MSRKTLVLVGFAATAFWMRRLYRRDMEEAKERLKQFDVREINIQWGRIEYTEWGTGDPLLVIHGVVGGWDGAPSWRTFAPPGYRSITPARFGYLGSTMPEDATPALQADAFVSLLDALGIDQVPVLGFSAGSTSAVQLALRHPERVSCLALLCANSPHPNAPALPLRRIAQYIFSGPFFWALRRFARPALLRLAGFPKGFPRDEEARREEVQIVDSFYPVGDRTSGIVFDTYESNPDIARYPLEDIAVPTLVVHAEDDPLASYTDARAMSDRIPGARFVSVPHGGHVFMHRDQNALREVRAFLAGSKNRDPASAAEGVAGRSEGSRSIGKAAAPPSL